jgi:HEAT repeat protein
MRQGFAVVLVFAFILVGTSLAGEERRGSTPPVSDLIKQLGDSQPDRVCAAARALGKQATAKEAAPALRELLKNSSGRVKWTAAEALWRLEHRAADLVSVYAELLTATDADVRAASAWRLGRLGSEARPAVAVLAAALRDENLEVRVQVGQALANLGGVAEPALPALLRALGDPLLDESPRNSERVEGARRSPALPALVKFPDQAIPLLIDKFRENASVHMFIGGGDDLSPYSPWDAAARAAHAFPVFGARAVAPLLRALDAKDRKTRHGAAVALREMAQFTGIPEIAIERLERCLDDPDEDTCRIAADAMSWVRPASTRAVTILVKAREEGRPDKALLAELERMGPHNEAARKLLLELLGDKHAETAQEAHRILADLELPADQALPVWMKALAHADSNVRQRAIQALRKFGPAAKSAKSKLHERFAAEKDYSCKGGILGALTAIDPDDPMLVPLLIRSLDDPESWVRWVTLTCLEDLGPRAKAALPRIKAHLLSPKKDKENRLDDSEMRHLVDALVRIAPSSAQTAATLLRALRDREIRAVHDPKNVWFMRDILEDSLQANLPAAAPVLREALKDADPEVRRSAALVLVQEGLQTETALPVLMEGLGTDKGSGEEPSEFRGRMVELLSLRRSAATPAVAAAWCKAWQTADPDARKILQPGLLVLQTEALPHLLEQLRQAKTPQTRRDLAHLLAHFEGQSKEILPILREELRQPHPASQYAAAQALMLLGSDGAEAVPELLPLLSSSHLGARAAGATALGRIGRAAKPAVPDLKAMLMDPNPKIRLLAASALGQIDPDATEALALLRQAFISDKNDPSWRMDGIELSDSPGDHSIYPDPIEESIARFGERAVVVLADILDNVDLDEWSADNVSSQCGASVRVQAARMLAQLGPDAHKAGTALIRALNDFDPFIRDAAASALGRIGPAAKEAAPACITLLERQNRAASAAGPWSSSARASGRSRAASRDAYGGPFDFLSLGRQRLLSEHPFGYGFGNPDPYAHLRPNYPHDAAYVLSRIDSEARSALPILREMARDPNHPGRLAAALAIWRSGGDSPDLVPAFAAALQMHIRTAGSETVPLSRDIHECLAELGTQLKPAVGVMAEWLKQPFAQQQDQVAVINALGRLGADARSQVDLLRPMLQGEHWHATRRVAAALALFQIVGERDGAFAVLREVFLGLEEHASLYYRPDLSDTARVHAARALGVLAASDERARSLLVEAAKGDENPYVRVAALETMARRKETHAAAMSGLCAVLRHRDSGVRLAAASACGRLGPLARSSARALRATAEDGQLAVRQAARQALAAVD